jgi:hypothetical protein
MGSIQPVGWVRNADGSDGSARVIIDSDGITILDGRIFLSDEAGDTVLNAAGFGGSWVDYLSNGFYNGTFAGGTTNAITAVTETGGGDTNAEYAASISSDLPYWIIYGYTGGGGTFSRIVDSTSVGGHALIWNGIVDAEIYQDVPVTPGQFYSFFLNWKYSVTAGEISQTIGYQFRDSTHGAIGSRVNNGLTYTTTQSTYTKQLMFITTAAPANARYLRVWIRHKRNSGTVVTTISDVSLEKSSISIGTTHFSSGSTFPSSPASGDVFFKTDIGEWCTYDGTRWVGEIQTARMSQISAAAANSNADYNLMLARSIKIVRWRVNTLTLTTNNGSNFWTIRLRDATRSSILSGTHGSLSLASDGTTEWKPHEVSNSDVVTTSQLGILFDFFKTGSPGVLHFYGDVQYRNIYT